MQKSTAFVYAARLQLGQGHYLYGIGLALARTTLSRGVWKMLTGIPKKRVAACLRGWMALAGEMKER
jgi:hypothetical protein